MANIKKRNNSQPGGTDAHMVESLTYNEAAGSRKVSEVGRSLLPLATGSGFTTNVSTLTNLGNFGQNLAVYNSGGSAGSITFGTYGTAVPTTSLAAGGTDANGNVGLPCPANSWSYFAAGSKNQVISSASTLLVFMIEDPTTITFQAQTNAST